MRFWKRTAAFLLCLGVSFSAFACGGKNGDKNSDSGNTNTSEGAGDSTGGNVNFDKAENLLDVLENAKSAKITVNAKATDTSGTETPIGIALWLTETDEGADLKAEISSGSAVISTIYVIDGWGYSYDAEEDAYTVSSTNLYTQLNNALAEAGLSMEQLETMIGEAAGSLESIEGAGNLGTAFGDWFETSAKLENGAMVVKMDYKDSVNAVLDYLATLTTETTLEEVVDDMLGLIDPTWTASDILTQLSTLGTVEVTDAYAYLDDLVKQETKYSIQNLKEVLIMNEDVQAALLEMGLTEEDIEMIDELDIEAVVEEYEGWTLNEFIAMIVESSELEGEGSAEGSEYDGETEEEPVDYVGEGVATLQAFLSETTLGDLETQLGTEGLVETLQMIGAIDVNKAEMKYGVKYDNKLKIDALLFGFALNMSNTVDGQVETVSLELDVTVSEISSERLTIALPENATVVYICDNCGVWSNGDESTVAYREEYNAYVCDDCLTVYAYEECEYCGMKAEDAQYRTDLGYTFCDDCYADFIGGGMNAALCENCESEEAYYVSEYDMYLCEDCYASMQE